MKAIDTLIGEFARKLAAGGNAVEAAEPPFDLAAVERRLPAFLPPSFRSLISRYSYLEFEIKPLLFFANTGEETNEQWRFALFADQFLSRALLANGYVQFARPDTGSYDPICFDTKRKQGNGESPIVWIDHEGILTREKIIVREEVAPSFLEFVQNYLA